MIQLGLRQDNPRPEVRESYTDMVVARLVSNASSVGGSGGALGAIEVASRWWGSGLASATVTPSTSALASVSPPVLDSIGRSLCRSGESLHVIDVRHGQVSLTPCGAWSVSGSDDPGSWRYRATMSGPTATRTVTIPAASVLHVLYSPDPARPWAGRSPMSMALSTARVAGLLEHATGEELNFVQKQLLTPRRGAGDYALTDTLSPDTIEKIVSAVAEHVGTGAFVIPADVTPQRLGPEPPDSFPLLRDRFENSILSLHGVSPALVQPGGTGTGAREAFRQLLHGTLRPIGALVVEELQAKLHPDAALDFASMRAGDISGISRAAGSLVKAGFTPQSVAAVVGLDGVEVKEVPA